MWHLYPLTCTCIHSESLALVSTHLHSFALLHCFVFKLSLPTRVCSCPPVFVHACKCSLPTCVRFRHIHTHFDESNAFALLSFASIGTPHSRPSTLLVRIYQHPSFASINAPRSRLSMLLVRVHERSLFAPTDTLRSRPSTHSSFASINTLCWHPSTLLIRVYQRSSFTSINTPHSRPSALLIYC